MKSHIMKIKPVGGSDRQPPPSPPSGPPHKPGWVSPVYSESQTASLEVSKLEASRCVAMFPDSREMEAYKVLRTQVLLRTREKGWNTIMVTSPGHGDGKTLTAINLALTFAREYSNTALLVDCDMKNQMVHKTMGYLSPLGLVDYLMDDRPLNDLIVWPGVEKLTIISGGRSIQNTTELLGSQRMKDLVREMKNRYVDRYVFFDVPPLLNVADALAFAPIVDGILMVVSQGQTPTPDVLRALELIPKEKFLGFVLNRIVG